MMSNLLKQGSKILFFFLVLLPVNIKSQNLLGKTLEYSNYVILIFFVIIVVLLIVLGIFLKKMKTLHKELGKQTLRAENSDRLKYDFLAQISHEIRTPVNSILCFSSLIQQELENKLSDELEEGFDIIEKGGKRLIRTIDLILNMSDVFSGAYEKDVIELDLNIEVIEPILREFRNISEKKNLEMEYINTTSKLPIVNCDKHTVIQVIIQLIDNAIKYTKYGKITVKLYKNVRGHFCIDVSDTGVGMSEEFSRMLFTPFIQEESGYTRQYEGNGLGLALVKKYCDLNNIEINVETKKWKGTKIVLSFPRD